MKVLTITAIATLMLFSITRSGQNIKKADQNKPNFIFPKGTLGSAENFTGKVWNVGLVEMIRFTTLLLVTYISSPEQEVTGTNILRARS